MDDCWAVSRQSWLILSLRYTTNALLECCPDDHRATLLPFLSESCGPGRRRCNR